VLVKYVGKSYVGLWGQSLIPKAAKVDFSRSWKGLPKEGSDQQKVGWSATVWSVVVWESSRNWQLEALHF